MKKAVSNSNEKPSSKRAESQKSSKGIMNFEIVHPNAAGIDIGSRSNWASIGKGKDYIREYGVFTEDHHAMARWLKENGVKTIAMESTGVYWKSLFLILEAYGFEVILVNARHIKNVKGKKSDMADCEWIWQLHSVGFLSASFQPDEFTGKIRTYNRHRRTLIQGSSRYVSKMQKALILMNLQLPIVLSDITGKSGQAIIKSILEGERNPKKLANLADPRVKASKEEIQKALTGFWHEQHLFTLQQSWDMYQFHQKQIKECDEKIEALLHDKVVQTGQIDLVYEKSPQAKKKTRSKNAPKVKADEYAYQLTDGVDLMSIDGVNLDTILTIIAEVGLDLKEKFPSAKHFASWLGLTPNKKITGGKVKSSRTQKNKNKLAYAFRQCANTVGNQKDTALSYFFRRIAYGKGRKKAIVATARKIAIIVYHMLTNKEAYKPVALEEYQQKVRQQKINNIQKTIKRLGIKEQEIVFT